MIKGWISCLGNKDSQYNNLHQSSLTNEYLRPPRVKVLFTQCLLKTTVLGLNNQRYYCFSSYIQTIIYYTPNPSICSIESILVFTPSTTASICPSSDQTFLTQNLFLLSILWQLVCWQDFLLLLFGSPLVSS